MVWSLGWVLELVIGASRSSHISTTKLANWTAVWPCTQCSDGCVHISLWKGRGVILAGSTPGAQRRAGRVGNFLLEKVSNVERNGMSSPRGRKSGAKGRRWDWGQGGDGFCSWVAPQSEEVPLHFPLHFPFCPKIHAGEEGDSQGTPCILRRPSAWFIPTLIWGEYNNLGSPRCPTLLRRSPWSTPSLEHSCPHSHLPYPTWPPFSTVWCDRCGVM